MRNVILKIPESSTANERRQVLRAAIRQLECAEIHLASVAYMELDDRGAQRAINQLRSDGESLRRYLCERRNRLTG